MAPPFEEAIRVGDAGRAREELPALRGRADGIVGSLQQEEGVVGAGHDGAPYEIYFCEADEPDEPDVREALDPAVESVRYAEALTAAGYEVTVDPHDEDVLLVRR